MIAFLACLGALAIVIGALHFLIVRPLQRKVATLERVQCAHEVRCVAHHRMRKAELAKLRRLSGEELEAVSERLDKVETRKTMPCQT